MIRRKKNIRVYIKLKISIYRSPILKILCTTHPDYAIRSVVLCKDSTIRIVACETGNILTSLICDLNFKATTCAYAIGESKSQFSNIYLVLIHQIILDILFVTNGNTLIKADTSTIPCKIIQQVDFTEC